MNTSPYGGGAYVDALVKKRNNGVARLLEEYPELDDIVGCDLYYLNQLQGLRALINDYTMAKKTSPIILGGATWGVRRMRLRDVFRERLQWYDRWGVPELASYRFSRHGHRTDFIKTRTVPGIHIFPRWLWDKGLRYRRLGDSTEPAGLCHDAAKLDVQTFVDFNARFYREGMYSRLKCLKCSIGLRSRLGLHTAPLNEPAGVIHR